MKISDEQLQAFKEMMEHTNRTAPQSDLRYQNILYMAMVEELQQHREEKRWRKISEEKPKRKDGNAIVVIWKDDALKQPVSMFFKNGTWWDADDGFYVDEDTIAYWRPLPTDLPEEE